MHTLILCAGLGSRLRPLTDVRPKCLVSVAGISILERQLKNLYSAGASEILIVSGYKGDQLLRFGHKVVQNPYYESTNMLSSFFIGMQEIPEDEDVLLSYGDIICEANVLAKVMEDTRLVSVVSDIGWRAYWESRFDLPESDAESFSLGSDNRLLSLGRPISSLAEPQGQFIGLLKIRAAARNEFKKLRDMYVDEFGEALFARSYMTDFLEFALRCGLEVGVIEIDRGWFEVDSARDLDLAEAHFRLNSR